MADDRPSGRSRSPLVQRRRTVLLIAGVAAVSSLAGLGASVVIRSPQQVAAEAKGPGPSVLTAVVERRTLQDTVVIRGTIVGSRTVDVLPAGNDKGTPIITSVRTKSGATVKAGQVILEVSGRPIFGMQGRKPAYRDLLPGSQGDDVAQLQSALLQLGHDPREHRGVFGSGTKRALAEFYDQIGYEAPNSAGTDQSAIDGATNAVVQADRTVEDAKAALGAARGAGLPPARTAVARAKEDTQRARSQLAFLESHTGVMLPLAEVVFLPTFPARVEKLTATVGATIKAAPLTLSSGALVVDSTVNNVQGQLLKVGMAVQIRTEVSDSTASGKISAIGELTATGDSGVLRHAITIKPDKPLPSKLSGQDVRLTVQRAATAEKVLVVPQSAVFSSADGSTALIRLAEGGKQVRVAVTLGTTGDGYVAVTPAVGEQLQPGNSVVIADSAASGPHG